MKILYTIFLLISFNAYSQSDYRFVFYDACDEKTIELDYELWFYDSTLQINAGQQVELKENYYLLSALLNWEGQYATFSYDIYTSSIGKTDTLYLNKIRSVWNGVLHPQIVNHYYCNDLANGEIIETDLKGNIRAKGKFDKGKAMKPILYYDEEGTILRKEVYRNGNLKRIKN